MKEIKMTLKEANECLVELETVLCWLENRFGKKFKVGRKEEVMDILREGKLISVSEIGKRVNISNRNVSSLLSYIRNDLDKVGLECIIKIGKGVGKLKLVNIKDL